MVFGFWVGGCCISYGFIVLYGSVVLSCLCWSCWVDSLDAGIFIMFVCGSIVAHGGFAKKYI